MSEVNVAEGVVDPTVKPPTDHDEGVVLAEATTLAPPEVAVANPTELEQVPVAAQVAEPVAVAGADEVAPVVATVEEETALAAPAATATTEVVMTAEAPVAAVALAVQAVAQPMPHHHELQPAVSAPVPHPHPPVPHQPIHHHQPIPPPVAHQPPAHPGAPPMAPIPVPAAVAAPVAIPVPMYQEPPPKPPPPPPATGSFRKIQVDETSPNAAPPSAPKERDIIFGDGTEGHQCNLLLQDLIALHKLVWEISHDAMPRDEAEVEVVTERLFQLMKKGKGRDLAGMKDVPRSFLVGSGRFMQKEAGEWKELSDEEAKKLMRTMIFAAMQENGGEADAPALKALGKEFHEFLLAQETETETQPLEHRPSDVILLQRTDNDGDKSFNNQSGNKALFILASQHVHSEVASPSKRLEAALSVFLSKNPATDVKEETEKPRFILCRTREDGQKIYSLVKPVDAAEVTLLFVFEVWLEKEMAAKRDALGVASSDVVSHDDPKPSTEPIETPTPHDVLFGRGGMTNSHPGNKRFRDVIALHRPDYIKAIKNDKPNVARRIVRAIRTASPPGRFLKKSDDGFWYDVGNRIAAEKASQALREKSNAEKRQRSAQREAMRNKREGGADSGGPSKKSKVGDAGISIASPLLTNQLNYVGAPIGSATQNLVDAAKSEPKTVKVDPNKEELKTEGLPPNAVDKDGNILVTDWDILAGRGGLTNHHRGNKRFRDIVALHRPDYIRAPKVQKPSVARVIVRAIRNGDPPGRFLKKDEKTGKWYDIGDKKAAEKTSQALREKGNDKERPPSANPAGDAKSPAFLLPAPTGASESAVPPLPVVDPNKAGVVAPEAFPIKEETPAPVVAPPVEAQVGVAVPHTAEATVEAAPAATVVHDPATDAAGSVVLTEAVPAPVEAPTAVVEATADALETALDAASKLPPEATTLAAPAEQPPAEQEQPEVKAEEKELEPQTVVV